MIFRTLLVCGLLVPGFAFAADLGTARDLLNQEKYEEAAIEANRYLSENPGDTQARFIRGLALARAGRVDAAISMFQELAKEYPDLAEPRNNLGVLYAQQGKFQQARESLEKATEVNPKHAPAFENLGDVYVALARDAFERAGGLEQSNVAVREKRQRLQALLDAPRGEEYANSPPIRSNTPAEEAIARPAPRPAPQAQPERRAESTEDSVLIAVNAWARAWSEQDVNAYIDAYSRDFQPANRQSYRAWERERRQRVSAPRSISVNLSDYEIQSAGDNRYVVSFLQRYSADNYQDRERKALLMGQEGGSWKILREDSPEAVARYARSGSRSAGVPETLAPQADAINEAVNTPASPSDASHAEISSVVDSWARAWSEQDLNGYFAAYSNNFVPGNGQSLRDWIRERQDRVKRPNFIRVRVDDLRIEKTGEDTANARFTQRYQADNYSDRESKTLRMRREASGWHIVREITN